MPKKRNYPPTEISTDQLDLIGRLVDPLEARGISRTEFRDILAEANFTVESIKYDAITSVSPVNSATLWPILIAPDRVSYDRGVLQKDFTELLNAEKVIVEGALTDTFYVEGFCIPCNQSTNFLVDMQSGGYLLGEKRIPNWRERLECPHCRMNNRQRLVATLVGQELARSVNAKAYFMEQVTPIYQWAVKEFDEHTICGSEYLGHQYASGQVVNGVRHEDIESLSFADEELTLIVSNDVFEHVPNPSKAFSECARVLRKNGVMIAAVPFRRDLDVSIARAKLVDENVIHEMPPVYHGNPVSNDGSLVFTDFGWDILNSFRRSGFASASLHVYASREFAHLGGGQLIFHLRK